MEKEIKRRRTFTGEFKQNVVEEKRGNKFN
jgi:hypothetical protein